MTDELKRKVSVSLDADLVREIEAEGESLSAQVNAALRNELTARRRHRALADLLDRLAAERGELDRREDEQAIRRFMRLLGGPDTGSGSTPAASPPQASSARRA